MVAAPSFADVSDVGMQRSEYFAMSEADRKAYYAEHREEIKAFVLARKERMSASTESPAVTSVPEMSAGSAGLAIALAGSLLAFGLERRKKS